jgi:hypothetical protein
MFIAGKFRDRAKASLGSHEGQHRIRSSMHIIQALSHSQTLALAPVPTMPSQLWTTLAFLALLG